MLGDVEQEVLSDGGNSSSIATIDTSESYDGKRTSITGLKNSEVSKKKIVAAPEAEDEKSECKERKSIDMDRLEDSSKADSGDVGNHPDVCVAAEGDGGRGADGEDTDGDEALELTTYRRLGCSCRCLPNIFACIFRRNKRRGRHGREKTIDAIDDNTQPNEETLMDNDREQQKLERQRQRALIRSQALQDGITAISQNDFERLSRLVCDENFRSGIEIWRNQNGESIVHVLSKIGNDKMLKMIIPAITTPGKLQELINTVVEPERGISPLHAAGENGHVACVNILIEKGASLEKRDKYGLTALHRAAAKGKTGACLALLKAGADLFAADNAGYSAWHRACIRGQFNSCTLFLQYIKDNNLKDEMATCDRHRASGMTSLHLVAAYVQQNPNELLTLLLDGEDQFFMYAINDNEANENMTPAHVATAVGNHEALQCLIDHGANINVFNSAGKTPLHLAVENNHLETCKVLLRQPSVALKVTDSRGNTAQDAALELGRFAILELFDNVKSYSPRQSQSQSQSKKSPGERMKRPSKFSIFSMLDLDDVSKDY